MQEIVKRLQHIRRMHAFDLMEFEMGICGLDLNHPDLLNFLWTIRQLQAERTCYYCGQVSDLVLMSEIEPYFRFGVCCSDLYYDEPVCPSQSLEDYG